MLIKKQIQIVKKVDAIVASLTHKYFNDKTTLQEIKKLNQSLQDLMTYLNKIQEQILTPTKDEVNSHIEAINLHLDILKELLAKGDYTIIAKGIKLIKTTLHFHPTKYTYWSFVKAWLLEWIYFI